MSRQTHINEEIEKTLGLFGNETPLKADPYFLVRLEARIREAETPGTQGAGFPWRRWRPVVLAALVGVNVLTAAFWLTGRFSTPQRSQALSAMAQDYAWVGETADWLTSTVEE